MRGEEDLYLIGLLMTCWRQLKNRWIKGEIGGRAPARQTEEFEQKALLAAVDYDRKIIRG